MIHEPNIPGSCAILFFIASDIIYTTRHNWASFPLCLSLFILSGAKSLLFPSGILDTFCPGGGSSFQCHIFLPFYTVLRILTAWILKWCAVPFSSGPCFVRSWLARTCPPSVPRSLAPWLSHCWSSWVCKPLLAAGCWSAYRLGTWAKAPGVAGKGVQGSLEPIDIGGRPGAEGSLASLLPLATLGPIFHPGATRSRG